MARPFLSLLFLVGTLFFTEISGAQEQNLSDYDLEKKYLAACPVKINKGQVHLSGEVSNCFMLGLLYTQTSASLRRAQKSVGSAIIKQTCQKGEQAACEYLRGGILVGKGSELIYWGAIIAIGLAVFLLANMMFQEEGEYQIQEKLEENQNKGDASKHGIVLKYSRPFFKRYVVPIVNSLKNKKKVKEKYKRKLATAGLTEVLTPEDFYSFKLFLVIGFPAVFLAMRAFLDESWSLNFVAPVAVLGYFYPDIWMSGKVKSRQKEIVRAMPFAVDMLALSVEAGLDFIAAISKVGEKAKPSALIYEFDQLLKEIKIGASRAEALRNMSWRVDLMQISSFCATLIAADSVGASIGPILKSLSVEIRQKKSSDAEKAGATAATKILFPMLFLIVPSVFIVVAAPVILGMFL